MELINDELKAFVETRYINYNCDLSFEEAWEYYVLLPEFKLNENIYEKTENYNADVQLIVRLAAQFYINKAFQAMKIDLNDPNAAEELENGNIGTPGRVAKMWVGSDLADSTELLSGRWTKSPRIASFPNTHKQNLPITKRVDLVAVCSHHIAPFSTFFREDSYALVSYIPNKKVLGISKLQRVVDWIARRGWLQEDLCYKIFKEISEVAETESVYVKLYNVSHTCESLRGSQTRDGAFTTEYFGGEFNDPEIRKQIRNE